MFDFLLERNGVAQGPILLLKEAKFTILEQHSTVDFFADTFNFKSAVTVHLNHI
jgi:hypothetical protein